MNKIIKSLALAFITYIICFLFIGQYYNSEWRFGSNPIQPAFKNYSQISQANKKSDLNKNVALIADTTLAQETFVNSNNINL